MHRLLIALFVMVTSVSVAHAQAADYDPVRIDAGLTGTYISGTGRGGFGAVFEAKFLATDQISVGGRIEAAVMFGGHIGSDGDVQMDLGAAAATLLKGEFMLTTGTVRPFVGLGIGVYDLASQSISAGSMMASIDQKAGRYFGVAPQIGVDLGRLRLAATYNAMVGADIEVEQTVGNAMQSTSYSQNYLTFEMSVRFGGGRITPMPTPEPGTPM